jgi:excisionase family DNA binding protein
MHDPKVPPSGARRFQTVAAVARLLDISEVTIYRAIHAGEFPAIKVRGRYVIPTSVVDAMETAALTTGAVVDAAAWVQTDAGTPAPRSAAVQERNSTRAAAASINGATVNGATV